MLIEAVPTTPICTSTPNDTDTTAWASIILNDETEMPAATQYWPACGENVFCSAGMTFAIVSAGVASALGALRGSSGYSPTSSIVGSTSLELMPKPPARPVMNRNGGPPIGAAIATEREKNV